MPRAPRFAFNPTPDANTSLGMAAVMSAIGVALALAYQPSLLKAGVLRIAASQSLSSGGRTVTRNSDPPPFKASSAFTLLR